MCGFPPGWVSGPVAGLLAEVTAQDLRTRAGDQLEQCIQRSAQPLARVEIALRSRYQRDASMPTSHEVLNHRGELVLEAAIKRMIKRKATPAA